MPIIGSIGGGSKGGYGRGVAKKYDIDFLVVAGGASGGVYAWRRRRCWRI
jgi:hypothetical protein